MSAYVCLLRGINVGGRNRVTMATLRAELASIGLTHVKTHVQSGNVVFALGSPTEEAALARQIQQQLENTLGLKPAIFLRSARQFLAVARKHPYFGLAGEELTKLQVAFLGQAPEQDVVDAIELPAGSEEHFCIRGREVFVFYPNGVGRSKVSGQFWESRLQQRCTMRNWKTVMALADLVTKV